MYNWKEKKKEKCLIKSQSQWKNSIQYSDRDFKQINAQISSEYNKFRLSYLNQDVTLQHLTLKFSISKVNEEF